MTRDDELLNFGSSETQADVVAAFLDDEGWTTYAEIVRRLGKLHTATWLLKRMRQFKSALQECETYFEEYVANHATAEYLDGVPCGDRETQLLAEVKQALVGLYDAERRAGAVK